MTDTFDYQREIIAAFRAPNLARTVEHLRTRIEAAFVPRADHMEDMRAMVARAEAAEARVAEITAQLATARESERAAKRGEFICTKCYLRQDADFTPGDF